MGHNPKNIIQAADLQSKIEEWQGWVRQQLVQLTGRSSKFSLNKNMAQAFLGVRRCGKTSQALLLTETMDINKVLYINFEDPAFHDQAWPILDQLIEQFVLLNKIEPEMIIFDEIQNIQTWEKWVRKFVDQKKSKLVITGSSAKMLSSELATALSGRALQSEIWPLSFEEVIRFKKLSKENDIILLAQLEEYLTWGGFPYPILNLQKTDRTEVLRQYFSDIVYRDVLSRHQIRTKNYLDQIINHYFVNLSCHHSYSALKKAYGIPTDTATQYTRYLQDAYLVFEVSRYHRNLKVQARDSKKIYLIDTGLRNANCYSETADRGKLLENQVYIELRRRKKQIYYFKENCEVDFVVCENRKPIELIQVCDSNLEDSKTYQRELAGLEEAMGALKINRGLVLTKSRKESVKTKTGVIQMMPAYQWFLGR